MQKFDTMEKIPSFLKKPICSILNLIGEKRINKFLEATTDIDIQKFLAAAYERESLKRRFMQ